MHTSRDNSSKTKPGQNVKPRQVDPNGPFRAKHSQAFPERALEEPVIRSASSSCSAFRMTQTASVPPQT